VIGWIVGTYLHSKDLVSASRFLFGLVQRTEGKENLSEIQPHLRSVFAVRNYWLTSSKKDKEKIVDRIDTYIIPTVVRAMDVQRKNKIEMRKKRLKKS
jgi:hypothetical protein